LLKLIIGLQLARLADLPKDALTHAGEIASDLGNESAQGHKSSESCKVAKRRKAVLKVGCATWKRLLRTFDISQIDSYHELLDENDVDTGF
jgi:DNA mismatch repair ATPase MutS